MNYSIVNQQSASADQSFRAVVGMRRSLKLDGRSSTSRESMIARRALLDFVDCQPSSGVERVQNLTGLQTFTFGPGA